MAAPGVEMRWSDWSQLPLEILDIIAWKSNNIADFVRFRAVCKTWRSSIATTTNGQPPWQPWLLLPYKPWSSKRRFFCPSSQKVYTLDLPESRHRAIRGTSHGWLLMVDRSLSFSLLNPITRTQVHLPFIEKLPNQAPDYQLLRVRDNIVIRYDDHHDNEIALYNFLTYFQCFTFMSEDNKFFVAVTHSRFLIYCQAGDEAWTTLHLPPESHDIETITYHRRRFYAIHCSGDVAVWDLDLGQETPGRLVPSLSVDPLYAFGHLVSFSDELLLITCRYINYHSMTISMYKLDEGCGDGQTWSKIDGNHYRSLFYAFSDENMIVTAAGDREGNSIYLADPYHGRCTGTCPVHGIDVISIGDGIVSAVPNTWFQTSYPYFRATWFVPSLC